MNWRFGRIALALLLCSSLLLATRLRAQSVQVPHKVACLGCSIEITRLFTVGSPTDPVLIDPGKELLRDSRGRFLSIGEHGAHVIVFDSTGKYLLSFGRKGDGPGEFGGSGARLLTVGRGDTVFVFDARHRMLVFSPTYAPVRTVTVGAAARGVAVIGNGNIVMTASMPNAGRGAPLIHELDSRGAIVRSFARDTSDIRPSATTAIPQSFVLAGDRQSIWFRLGRYGAEQVRIDGSPGDSFEIVDVPWLSNAPAKRLDTIVNRQRTIIAVVNGTATMMGVDRAGLVWFLGTEYVGDLTPQMVVSQQLPPAHDRIEVFDPRTRQLLVSQEVDGPAILMPGTDLAYAPLSDADGVVTCPIFRVRLRRP